MAVSTLESYVNRFCMTISNEWRKKRSPLWMDCKVVRFTVCGSKERLLMYKNETPVVPKETFIPLRT